MSNIGDFKSFKPNSKECDKTRTMKAYIQKIKINEAFGINTMKVSSISNISLRKANIMQKPLRKFKIYNVKHETLT